MPENVPWNEEGDPYDKTGSTMLRLPRRYIFAIVTFISIISLTIPLNTPRVGGTSA